MRVPRTSTALVGLVVVGVCLAAPRSSGAQLVPEPAVSQMDWQLSTVRASGQPVVPIFEGWYTNEDGTYDLCFGFFNLNRDEALHIPFGPDNFMEPASYGRAQPTHFGPLGPGRMVREYCVFTVNVPADIGEERVWWNLRRDGHTYRVPGHITSRPWRIDNLANSVASASMELEGAPVAGSLVAPIVRFVDPSGPEGRGKGGVTLDGVRARVGEPLSLTISVVRPAEGSALGDDLDPDEEGVLVEQSLKWTKFRGPAGEVRFSTQRASFEVGPTPTEQSTRVTFSEPGDYTLLVQVLSGSFSSQCCWTNAYVTVSVTE